MSSERADAAGADADAGPPAGEPSALPDGVRVRPGGVAAGLAVIDLVVDVFDRAATGFTRAEVVADVEDPGADPADCGSATAGPMLVVSGEPWLAGVKNGDAGADGPRSCRPGAAGAGDSVKAVRRASTSAPPAMPPADAAYGLTAAG